MDKTVSFTIIAYLVAISNNPEASLATSCHEPPLATMASQDTASQDTDDGLAKKMNGVALSASQDPEFDVEEDNYESSQTEEIQETIASDEKDEFQMELELQDMLAVYMDKYKQMNMGICHTLAMAAKLEDFRCVCVQLDPKEFPNLVLSSKTLTPFHVYLTKLDTKMPSYPVFR